MVLVRAGAWIALFDRELAEAAWQAVVKEWVPRLALRSLRIPLCSMSP